MSDFHKGIIAICVIMSGWALAMGGHQRAALCVAAAGFAFLIYLLYSADEPETASPDSKQEESTKSQSQNTRTAFSRCDSCGESVNPWAISCQNCRAPTPRTLGRLRMNQERLERNRRQVNRLAAALLAFFLGNFGLHCFYMRRPIVGILHLLMCWTFIPALIGFVTCIYILSMDDETFWRDMCG